MMTPKVIDPVENRDPAVAQFDVSARSEKNEVDQSGDKTDFPSEEMQKKFKKSRKVLGL